MGVAPLVTVIIPTFDHAETLRYSIPTALSQTHDDLQVIVVGDGAPETTRHIVEEFASADPRVTYRYFEKGPRNGEAHRHRLLLDEARGDVVFYLGDDDLWLPDHVETMLETMDATGANFVSCQPCWVGADGSPGHRWVVDLSLDWFRSELMAGRNRVPLNCAAHTMELYRRLPFGWRTTPAGTPTDLYMWQQVLAQPAFRGASTPFTTVIGVPSSERAGQSLDRRVAELAAWSPTTDPAMRERFLRCAQVAEWGLLDQARHEAEYNTALRVVSGMEAERDQLRAEAGVRSGELAALRLEYEGVSRELIRIYASRGWRLLEWLRIKRRWR